MSALLARFHRLTPVASSLMLEYLRYGLMILLGSFVVIKLFALESQVASQQKLLLKQTALLSQQQALLKAHFNHLENNLAEIEETVKTQVTIGEAIKACRTELENVKTVVQRIQTQTDSKTLASVIKQAYPAPMNATLTHSKQHTNQKKKGNSAVIHCHHLPFQVVNIDSWNGEAMVMVNHQGHIDLLGKDDTLAGWTVTAIHFAAGRVTFKHRTGQLIQCVI
jgi:hypothetical protein